MAMQNQGLKNLLIMLFYSSAANGVWRKQLSQ